MGVRGKPFHVKPPVPAEAGPTAGVPAHSSSRGGKPGPEAPPRPAPELVDAAFAGTDIATNPQWLQFFDICKRIQGFPRHLSIHVGGMLVTGEPLIDMLPVERATMPGRVVVQFNKDDVEDLGLIKMDMLGLRTLSVVEECVELIRDETGERLDLDTLDLNDPEVYRTASEADTVGVFQIESRAQMATLPRTKPDTFRDLVVEVAIIRPGPIQGNAVNPYIRRRQGREPVTYPHPKLEPILKDTLGVILFQEQILSIAIELGGYTPAQADGFRRAMGRHRSKAEMEKLREGFLESAARYSGVDDELGNQIFNSISGFAEFGFCRCLGGDTRITDPLTGGTATLGELADAPPPVGVTSVLSLGPDRRLRPAAITALYRNGVHPTYRVVTQSGAEITATGNHPFLTQQGYRQLDDLAPGCEVALHWSGEDIFWNRVASIELIGEQETFDLTVEPFHNFTASGFVVHNSHAAAFARTTYETVWLKNHYPAQYYCGLLNNQPMGFYHPSVLVEDAKRKGIRVLPVDINESRERCLPVPGERAFRLGFNYVRSIGAGGLERLRRDRERGPYRDLEEFCDRLCRPLTAVEAAEKEIVRYGNPGTSLNIAPPAPVSQEGVENLVQVGAFDFLGVPRRKLLWQVRDAVAAAGQAPLVESTAAAEAASLPLPEMTRVEVTAADYRVLELTTGPHLVAYYRAHLEREGAIDSRALKQAPHNSKVRIGGLVITRQAPGTAKHFRFFTMEDEWGHINLILHPDFFKQHRAVCNRNDLLMFDGIVQAVDGTISIKATGVAAMPTPEVTPTPHNYR